MTEENLTTINYLTEEQYNTAKANGEIKENELYMTPDDEGGTSMIPNSRNLWCMPEGKISNGVTFTVNKDGSMNIKGTAAADQSRTQTALYIDNLLTGLTIGKTYKLSTNQKLPEGCIVFVSNYNGENWVDTLLQVNNKIEEATNTCKLSGTRVCFCVRVDKGYTVDISNLKIYLTEETEDKVQVADALNDAWLAINKNSTKTNFKKLWENSKPTQNFAAQTVTLSEPIEHFRFYTIIYALATDAQTTCFSNTVKSGGLQRTTFAAANIMNWRHVTAMQGTKCTFSDNVELKTYGGSTVTANQRCIPLVIIGHE